MSLKAKNLALAAMFLALGLVLPLLTGQVQQIGNMLLPMHIPVFLCGLICGWRHGAAVGFLTPMLRSVSFGMPPMYPVAIAMAFELAVYGGAAGFLYRSAKRQSLAVLYRSMVLAMLAGRAVWGIAEVVLLGLRGNAFSWQAFLAGAFLNAIPGIILQLILIPAVMIALDKAGLVPFRREGEVREDGC